MMTLRLRLLAYLLPLLPLLGHTQGMPLDAPSAPQIRLIDRHYRHAIGTGFLLELDLSVFRKPFDTLLLQPVNQVDHAYAMQRPDNRLPDRTRNPLVGLFRGIAAFGELARRPTQLPLPLQLVIPLDSGVVLDESGNLLVVRTPPTGRIRLFIPQLLMQDGNQLYLILGAEGETFYYVQSQQLFIDRILPDIELTLKGTERGRYLGAQGQWVTLFYQAAIPPQLGSAREQMTLQVLLNDRHQVPSPRPDGPDTWPSGNGTAGEIRCFVPDALAQADGNMQLDLLLTLPLNDQRTLVSRQKVLLRGRQPLETLSVRFFRIEQTMRPANPGAKPFTNLYIVYTLGGTRVHASDRAKDQLSSQEVIGWDDPLPAEVPLLPEDELGVLVCSRTPDWFCGTTYLYFQLSAADFPKGAKSMEVVKKFKNAMGIRYRWTLRAEYEWLDGALD